MRQLPLRDAQTADLVVPPRPPAGMFLIIFLKACYYYGKWSNAVAAARPGGERGRSRQTIGTFHLAALCTYLIA